MEDLEDVILNCQGDNEFGELLMFKDQVLNICGLRCKLCRMHSRARVANFIHVLILRNKSTSTILSVLILKVSNLYDAHPIAFYFILRT